MVNDSVTRDGLSPAFASGPVGEANSARYNFACYDATYVLSMKLEMGTKQTHDFKSINAVCKTENIITIPTKNTALIAEF